MNNNNIIHRDVKPENIFMANEDLLILNDWSSAYQIPESGVAESIPWVGTRFYSSSVISATGQHVPRKQDDLISLVRTALVVYCNQIPPDASLSLTEKFLSPPIGIMR